MEDFDTKVSALVASPLGCAFLLVIDASGISPATASQPAVSLRAAALAVGEVQIWREDHASVVEEVFRRGRQHRQLARAILENPLADWWFAPLARDRQAWVSNDSTTPSPTSFVLPTGPLSGWERYAQKSAAGLYTSTLTDGTSSVLSVLDEGGTDLRLDFPVACWRLHVGDSARVYEVNGPLRWHELCVRYPAIREDGRLTPDWPAVASDWDGAHLTLGGLLTSEQVRMESKEGWSQLWGWDVEQTLWLRWVFKGIDRLADHEESFSRAGLVFPRLSP